MPGTEIWIFCSVHTFIPINEFSSRARFLNFILFNKKLRPEDINFESNKASARLIDRRHKRMSPQLATVALALVESMTRAPIEATTLALLNSLAWSNNAKVEMLKSRVPPVLKQVFYRAIRQIRDVTLQESREMQIPTNKYRDHLPLCQQGYIFLGRNL